MRERETSERERGRKIERKRERKRRIDRDREGMRAHRGVSFSPPLFCNVAMAL